MRVREEDESRATRNYHKIIAHVKNFLSRIV